MPINSSRAWSNGVRTLSAAFLLAGSVMAHGADKAADLISRAAADPALRQTLVAEGAKAAFFCANCHGEAGMPVGVQLVADRWQDARLLQIALTLMEQEMPA